MKVVIWGIAMLVLWGGTIIAQEENDPLEIKINKRDSVIFKPKMNPYGEFDFNAEQLKVKPELDWNYQVPKTYEFKGSDQIRKSLIAPAVLLGVGLYSGSSDNTQSWMGKRTINNSLQNEFEGFHSSVDDYLQWGPIVMAYGLKASGLRGANDAWTSTKLLIKAELLTAAVIRVLKHTTDNTRPDGKGEMSFPSGHTSQAFVAATFLHREYGHISPFYSIAGYAMATTVGTMRMLNQRHWFNDVTVGAAMGIAMTNLVYWQHDRRADKKRRKMTAIPTFSDKGAAVSMLVQF